MTSTTDAAGSAEGAPVVHRYRASATWAGSTAAGYDGYDRAHDARVEPADLDLALSSDPAFRGDPTRANPEQLLLLAASSCQLLSFLTVAARARLDVVSYTDDASAVMPEDDRPVRITAITLRPSVELRVPDDADRDTLVGRVRHLMDVAHRECFIANSLTSEMTIEPTIRFV
jgi:organic hydroperoxide reductase OsmC/OhrA